MNASSPTASTSSTSRTSGSTWMATAEPEPHVHAGRVGLDRRVDEVLELGKRDDLVEAVGDLALGEPEHHAVDEDVLAAGDLGMKAGAQLDERRHAAAGPGRCPPVGLPMPAMSLSIVLLPEPLRPTMPKVSPAATSNDTPFSASNVSSGCRSRSDAAGQQRALQRARTACAARSGGRPCGRRAPRSRSYRPRGRRSEVAKPSGSGHTSSASVSRSRSNTKYPMRAQRAEAAPTRKQPRPTA